jgi:maltose O-acetyltransferase
LLTATHPVDAATRRARWESAQPITIEDGAWLGGGVIVCPGVTIGSDAVIGAGSVVTRNIPAGVVAVGNPCRVIRDARSSVSGADRWIGWLGRRRFT